MVTGPTALVQLAKSLVADHPRSKLHPLGKNRVLNLLNDREVRQILTALRRAQRWKAWQLPSCLTIVLVDEDYTPI